MRLNRLFVVLLGVVAALIGCSTGTTTASAATFTYDIPTAARVGVHEIGATEASPAQLSEAPVSAQENR